MAFYAELILNWYDQNKRELPWRALSEQVPDPYHVLISEFMLQQTQVATVIPYYKRFLERFPTLQDLAKAELEEVIAVWSGLGYYVRVRNLHRCAKQLCTMGGKFPQTMEELKALPGIGNYTAAAILAIAFNKAVVPVDGNVERVTARLFGIMEPLPSAKAKCARLAATLNRYGDATERASDFAQALFDIGATICKPKKPLCLLCPLAIRCEALRKNLTDELPRRKPKVTRPVKNGIHFCLMNHTGDVLFRKRPVNGLLGGTLELPGTPWRTQIWSLSEAMSYSPCAVGWHYGGKVKHNFTHFLLNLEIYVYRCDPLPNASNNGSLWYSSVDMVNQPFSTLMRKTVGVGYKAITRLNL